MARVSQGTDGRFVARPVEERFWEKVDAEGICWEWTGTPDAWGYGKFKIKKDGKFKPAFAHRCAWEFLVGPIPEHLSVDHLCRNRLCVNPDHMELVPIGVNVSRGFPAWKLQMQRTECERGHLYTESSTRWWRGKRICRTCDAANARRRRYMRKMDKQ